MSYKGSTLVVAWLVLATAIPMEAVAQAWPPPYDAATAGAFNVPIDDRDHWTELAPSWAPAVGGEVRFDPAWNDPWGSESSSFSRAEAHSTWCAGNGFINLAWDYDRDRTTISPADCSHTRTFEHREDGMPTPGTVTLINCSVRVDVLISLTDAVCRGAMQAATQYECIPLGVVLTASRNFSRSTNSTQIGQASFTIGPIQVNIAFSGGQEEGDYPDGVGSTTGGQTTRVSSVGITHRTRARIDLYANDGAFDFTGAACGGEIRGFVNSTTRLTH